MDEKPAEALERSRTPRCWWRRGWSPAAKPTRWSRRATPAPACWPARGPSSSSRACGARRWRRCTRPRCAHGEKDDPFSLILDVGRDGRRHRRRPGRLRGDGRAPTRGSSPATRTPRWRCSRTAPRPEGPAAGGRGARAGSRSMHGPPLHRQRRGRRHSEGHRRRDRLRRLRRQRLPEDARGRARDGGGARALRLQGEAAVARRPGDALRRHRAAQGVTDWEQYGGAPMLGFDRVFIKAHGRSKARAIANAGKVAAKAVHARSRPRDPRGALA